MISLGPTPFSLEVVQNESRYVAFVLNRFWDERAPAQIPQDVTGWTFTMLVKRRTDDTDAFAVFEINNGLGVPPAPPPTVPAGAYAIVPLLGEFFFMLRPPETDIAPGEYFGEIRAWDPTVTPGVDPPYIKMPFQYRVVQTLDLVYP